MRIISFSVSPPCVSAIAGLVEAKNVAGKSPPPDSDPFDVLHLYGNSADFVQLGII